MITVRLDDSDEDRCRFREYDGISQATTRTGPGRAAGPVVGTKPVNVHELRAALERSRLLRGSTGLGEQIDGLLIGSARGDAGNWR